jgi:hypothetical protein
MNLLQPLQPAASSSSQKHSSVLKVEALKSLCLSREVKQVRLQKSLGGAIAVAWKVVLRQDGEEAEKSQFCRPGPSREVECAQMPTLLGLTVEKSVSVVAEDDLMCNGPEKKEMEEARAATAKGLEVEVQKGGVPTGHGRLASFWYRCLWTSLVALHWEMARPPMDTWTRCTRRREKCLEQGRPRAPRA